MLAIIVVTFVYGDYIDVDGFVYGFGLSTAVTFVLFLTFVPKVGCWHLVYRNTLCLVSL